MEIKVGDVFNCYDDGKVTPMRHSSITITEVQKYSDLEQEYQKIVDEIVANLYNLYIKNQKLIIKGKTAEGKEYLFLENMWGDYFSVDYWGPGLLDITGECTEDLIKSLHDGSFDYTSDEVEYIVSCLNNKENIDMTNPIKNIKDILSNIE